MSEPDADLVAVARRGSQRAFQQLVERHQQAVRGFLRRTCADPGDADDLAQETFLTAWSSLLLYRGGARWAIGATASFAPRPTSDTGYGLGGSSGLARSHSRDYLFVGGEARFIPLHYRLFEGWVGAQLGGIIIADRFTATNAGIYSPIIPAATVNERTEGLSGGLQVGMSYSFSESFVVGFLLRADAWVLPSTPNCDAIGDCATLRKTAAVYEGGFTFGYRLPL